MLLSVVVFFDINGMDSFFPQFVRRMESFKLVVVFIHFNESLVYWEEDISVIICYSVKQ